MQSVVKENRGFSFLPGQTQEGGGGSSWKRWEISPYFSRLHLAVLPPHSNHFPLFRLREAPSFPGGKDISSLLISYQKVSFGNQIWYFLAGPPSLPSSVCARRIIQVGNDPWKLLTPQHVLQSGKSQGSRFCEACVGCVTSGESLTLSETLSPCLQDGDTGTHLTGCS